MTHKIALTAILAVLATNAAFADVVIQPKTGTHPTENCAGNPIGDSTGDAVNYRAVWDENVYQFTLDPKHYTSASDNTGSGPNPGEAGTSVIYEKYGIGWFKTGNTTTRVVSDQIEVSGEGKNIVVPEYDGYGFGGYFRCKDVSGDTDCEQIITSTGFLQNNALNTLTSDGTLYAKWTANEHTITYDCGTGVSGQHPSTQSESIDFNGNWSGIPNANSISNSGTDANTATVTGCSKEGWHPVSWSCVYDDSGSTTLTIPESGTTLYNVDDNATCTLQWERNNITLTWDPDNGNTMADTYCDYDTTNGLIIPANPEKTGYTFMGWEIVD